MSLAPGQTLSPVVLLVLGEAEEVPEGFHQYHAADAADREQVQRDQDDRDDTLGADVAVARDHADHDPGQVAEATGEQADARDDDDHRGDHPPLVVRLEGQEPRRGVGVERRRLGGRDAAGRGSRADRGGGTGGSGSGSGHCCSSHFAIDGTTCRKGLRSDLGFKPDQRLPKYYIILFKKSQYRSESLYLTLALLSLT